MNAGPVNAGQFWRDAAQLPLAEAAMFAGALILAPHPDDESLGCGGLIAALCAAGLPPLLAVLTDGTGSHPHSRTHPAGRLRDLREAETRAAAAELGLPASRVAFLRYRDTAAPREGEALAEAAGRVHALAAAHRCTTILAPWRHDPHCDHEAADRIAVAVAAQGLRHFAYPVWGLTLPPGTPVYGPAAGYRLDVRAHLPAKRRAIQAHRSQYAGIITDDPAGFQMQPGFMALFDGPSELYLEAA